MNRSKDESNLLAEAVAKARVFRDRYQLLYQRIMRNEAFSAAGFSAASDDFCQVKGP
jgi:hypothetical protein